MFKNILCPIDMHPRSKMALRKAISIAHQFNSKIVLLSIHEEFISKKQMIMSRVSVSSLGDEFKKIAIEAKKDMKNLVKELEADDIKCEYILRDGVPADIIVKLSNELDIDLIVMGTNGRDSLTDYIVGSTAQKVVEKSKCPVLVMPKGKQ
jgi:nucleotide-binding universal stress UspA family protein